MESYGILWGPMRFYGKKILRFWISMKTWNNIEEKSSDHRKVYPALIEFLERLQLRIQDAKLFKKNTQKHACVLKFIVSVPDKRWNSDKFFYDQNKVLDWDLVFQDDPRSAKWFHRVLNEDQFSFLKNFCFFSGGWFQKVFFCIVLIFVFLDFEYCF